MRSVSRLKPRCSLKANAAPPIHQFSFSFDQRRFTGLGADGIAG
jgi:hypothetical protein